MLNVRNDIKNSTLSGTLKFNKTKILNYRKT